MYIIKIDEERGIVNNTFKVVKTYKVLGIPVKKYTYIKRDKEMPKVINSSDGVPLSVLESLEHNM